MFVAAVPFFVGISRRFARARLRVAVLVPGLVFRVDALVRVGVPPVRR